jgi:uncharacterized protein YdhG (YjbR/CyaY superfamily)
MATARAKPATIDEYIAMFGPDVQAILKRVREVVAKAAPDATEGISYQIPTFKLNGALVYFAAFKNHIGFYPPVRGDAKLEAAVRPYAGEKGNLKFPLAEAIPYGLIARIVKHRVQQNRGKAAARKAKSR